MGMNRKENGTDNRIQAPAPEGLFDACRAEAMVLNKTVADDPAYRGKIYGRYNSETATIHALFREDDLPEENRTAFLDCVGLATDAAHFAATLRGEETKSDCAYLGAWFEDGWRFIKNDAARTPILIREEFSFVQKAFSRNAGLLETDRLLSRTAVLIGTGSVGGFAALDLARAGVGRFVLIDEDTFAIHNLSRHILDLREIGSFKVDAVKRAILAVNPLAKVRIFRGRIQEAPEALFEDIAEGEGVVISGADNRAAGALANALAARLGIPFVAVGLWTRACVGEIFCWSPKSGLPTYAEAFAGMLEADRPETHRQYFTSVAEEETLRAEPGINTDITFVTALGVTLGRDLLQENEKDYHPRVAQWLTNYTLVCNTNRPDIGGAQCAFFPEPLKITTRKDGIWLREAGAAAKLTISCDAPEGEVA